MFFSIVMLFCIFGNIQADPLECVDKETAYKMVEHLKENPYIIEDCYYCEKKSYRLMYVEDAWNTECHYDTESYTVSVEAYVIYTFQIDDCVSLTYSDIEPDDEAFIDFFVLNYTYVWSEDTQSAHLFSNEFGIEGWTNCKELLFPKPEEIEGVNEDYALWYKLVVE